MPTTTIKLDALQDELGGPGPATAYVTARATAARVDGPRLILPVDVELQLEPDVESALVLDTPTPGVWAWELEVLPEGWPRREAITGLYTFPAGDVDWGAMEPVDPATLAPLDPLPPSVAEVLVEAAAARDAAQTAAENSAAAQASAAGYAGAASLARSDAEDARDLAILAEGAAVAARNEAVDVADSSVVDADVVGDDLVMTRKDGTTFDAGNVRGLPGSVVPWGTDLGVSDLNTIVAQGVYRQPTNANATLARNYPLALNGGILEVFHAINGGNLVQRFTVYNGLSRIRSMFVRRIVNGVADPWMTFASQRIDKTAGLAIYSWDEQAQRDQLTYGDTGWRQLSGVLENGWTANTLLIRRIGRDVIVRGYYLNPAAATSDTFVLIPAGFRRSTISVALPVVLSNTGALAYISVAATALTAPRGVGIVGSTVAWEIRYEVDEAWPTILPGSASGTIPNT